MQILLISTYEIGRQPFGVASAASWLQDSGAEVDCLDLAVEELDEEKVKIADVLAFYVPMHTATRIAIARLPRVRDINPRAHLCFFGLYAPVNEDYLRKLGVHTVLGGEFEEGLSALVHRVAIDGHAAAQPPDTVVSLDRQQFRIPDRSRLPLLNNYAKVVMGNGRERVAGYTEATRGCLHLCRHCPIVPVYNGRFRVVQREVVLADVRQQVAQGAQHITFGDPDFFNGPSHALAIVRELHSEFPGVSYDVTIKIQHLRKQLRLLSVLRDTGCLFVTSAVESVDEKTLRIYEKNHTKQDFIDVAHEFRKVGLTFNPTFVTFSPWTTIENYAELLSVLIDLELVDNVAPIQLAIRLLIPMGSRLLELSEVQEIIGAFDEEALCYRWRHPDPRVDELHTAVLALVEQVTAFGVTRRRMFSDVCALVCGQLHSGSPFHEALTAGLPGEAAPKAVPMMTEPWYCCAEPTEKQLLGKRAQL